MKCRECGRDINEIWSVNMSYENSYALCEDCARRLNGGLDIEEEFSDNRYVKKRILSRKQFMLLLKHSNWSYIHIRNATYEESCKKISQILYNIKRKETK